MNEKEKDEILKNGGLIKKPDNGYMNTHASKSFQRIYKEFLDTILKKYCDETKHVCSLGCYNDDLADQIKFKTLTLVDQKFGPCKHNPKKMNRITLVDVVKTPVVPIDYGIPIEVAAAREFQVFYLEQGFCEFFRYNQAKYDVIIMSTVIEHLEQPEDVLYLIGYHLAPNGIFIMTYPNAFAPNRLLGWQMGLLSFPNRLSQRDFEVGHKRMYGFNDLKTLQRYLGLKLVQEIGIMFKPLPHSLMSQYFLDDLDVFIELGYKLGPKACSYVGGVFQNVLKKND